jgi:TetR/AcrR family transcriptional regulator, regulator of mycofactocin system
MTESATHGVDGAAEVARGRRPATSRQDVARAALDLFDRQGYEATTVDQISAAVGVSRRTFFRYYDSKSEVVWGEFDAELIRLRHQLEAAPEDQPMMDVLRAAVMATNRFGANELDELRTRIRLTSSVPSLVAHSAVRYAEWREVVADFVARRIDGAPDDLGPQTVARAALGAAMAAFDHWASHGSDDLIEELDQAFGLLATGFDQGRLQR